jgi:hypothetical protein
MTSTSFLRRVSTSAVVVAAAAAISLGGSTEAWGQTSSTTVHHSVNVKTSTWELTGPHGRTSTWEMTTGPKSRTSTWE